MIKVKNNEKSLPAPIKMVGDIMGIKEWKINQARGFDSYCGEWQIQEPFLTDIICVDIVCNPKKNYFYLSFAYKTTSNILSGELDKPYPVLTLSIAGLSESDLRNRIHKMIIDHSANLIQQNQKNAVLLGMDDALRGVVLPKKQ